MEKTAEYRECMPGFLNARDFGASGSDMSVKGKATAGSCRIGTEGCADFAAGQWCEVSAGMPRCDSFRIFGPHSRHAHNRPVEGEAEYRGWDGSNGSHVVYLLDVDPDRPAYFRWSDDLGRNWQELPITGDWQELSGGLEIRLREHDWQQGWVITLVMRSSYTARIVSAENDALVLDRPAAADATVTVRHDDRKALQAAIDEALGRDLGVYLPNGLYRIAESLVVERPRTFTLQGASAEGTVLDIGKGGIGVEAEGGSCLVLRGGTEARIRDLSFRGGMGFAERDQAGHMPARGATGVWGFYFMKSNAMSVWGTRRVYAENLHASHMSAECFYSCSSNIHNLDFMDSERFLSRCRDLPEETRLHYSRLISYVHCSVTDCARNAFNNNDKAENTQIISCRIEDVGGNTWEGASRFVKMQNCYVRNSGCVAMGNVRSRGEALERLGTGQHVIADNVFEGGTWHTAQIQTGAAAEQVIIRNNTFVNFNGNGIWLCGNTGPFDLPAQNAIVTGNSMDMTCEDGSPAERFAVRIEESGVTVADNQIFVNGAYDPEKGQLTDGTVTGIEIRDDAAGLLIHDNLLHGCGTPVRHTVCRGTVGKPVDDLHFLRWQDASWLGEPPVPRRRSHHYRGWHILWADGTESVLDNVDPESGVFTLTEPRPMQKDEVFTLHPDETLQRSRVMHDNVIY